MKIHGLTDDGRQITHKRVDGQNVEIVESIETRDLRLEAEAYELVRNTAPELLQACRGLLALIVLWAPSCNGISTSDDLQAYEYALAIVRKLDPDYGKLKPPPPGPSVTG